MRDYLDCFQNILLLLTPYIILEIKSLTVHEKDNAYFICYSVGNQ